MAIRMSGLNSGLDTDAIVKALVSGYTTKKENYEKAKTKLEWKQDAWKSLNTKIYSLYTNVSNLRFSSAYNLRKTSVSDQTKATVTATNNAVNGTQKLNILKTAQAASMTGGKLDKGTKTTTTLAELGYAGGDTSFDVVKKDGTVSGTVNISGTSTIGDVVNQLKDAGLNASFDETNGRFFVSAKESGVENDFELMGSNGDATSALMSMGLYTKLTDSAGNSTNTGSDYAKYAAYKGTSDADTQNKISDAVTAYRNASDKVTSTTTQISNLTAGISYAKSYAAVQQYYSDYAGAIDNNDRYAAVVANYSSSSTAVVDNDGNIFQATSVKDKDGNTVYSGKDSGGNTVYMSKVVTYSDGANTYKKDENGKYVKQGASEGDADYYFNGDTKDLTENTAFYETTDTVSYAVAGKEDAVQVVSSQISNGGETQTQYTVTVDGESYVSNSQTGEFTSTSDPSKKLTIEAKYTYESTGTSVDNLEKVTDAYDAYKNGLAAMPGLTEDEAAKKMSELQANLKTVNNFEAAATDSGTNSKSEIVTQVHAQGTAADSLAATYSASIATLKTEQAAAKQTMEDNELMSSIAGIEDPTERAAAITKMVGTVNAAAAAIAADGSVSDAKAAVKVSGADAEIKLNGVSFTSSSNSFSINGLTINALTTTGDGDDNAISITTATDTQGIYDKIKEFLTEYNNVINEMTKLYSADSAKNYEPLTDDEKEEMSDKEIEKWEQKIKDSLLRSDTTLNGVMNVMQSAMNRAITVNGKNYSLVSFGVHTMGYLSSAENEQYSYHIDGDEDDDLTSGNTDKLMAAISENPEDFMSFFQQLTAGLYNAVGDKMKGTTLSSSYTVYNDKQMSKEVTNYTKLISEWEEKISAKEDYYYNKFTAMETAMAKLNSTQSSLSGYFS